VTAKGSVFSSGPASYYRIFNNSSDLAESTAQIFLGVRLQCAKCHHHPFEKYGQDDYYSFAAFFARVGTKNSDEFGLFGDWSERYQYLIDLGRKLPDLPDELKTEDNRLTGCQSMVWIVASGNADQLDFSAISDSAIVSGLIALLLRIYSGRRPADILGAPAEFVNALQLQQHLSPTRSNGLAAMMSAIRKFAAAAQDDAQ